MRSGSALSFSNTFMAASAASATPSASSSAAPANWAQPDLDLDSEASECPLCMEELDLSDLNFKPCPCGYQICRFCWHHIKQNLNGSCPACRKVYDDKAVEFTPLKPEDLKKLQAAKKQRDREKKDQEINSKKHLANVRVKQKTQVHIQGMTAKLAHEENIPLLKSQDWFGQHGKILKLFLAKRTNMPESMQNTIDTKNQPVNVYINYASQREAATCITAVDGTTTPDGWHRLRAGWGTTKYCPAYLRNQRCQADNCMMAHEPGEEMDPVGGAPGPITREEMSTLKHAMKEQESREAQQRYGGGPGGSHSARLPTGLPATASWAKTPGGPSSSSYPQPSPPLSSTSQMPSGSNHSISLNIGGSSSNNTTHRVLSLNTTPKPPSTPSSLSGSNKSHPLPARPTSERQNSQSSSSSHSKPPSTIRRPSTSTANEQPPQQSAGIVTSIAPAGKSTPAPIATETQQQQESEKMAAPSAPPTAPPGLPPPPGFGYAAPSSATPMPSTSTATLDENHMVQPFSAKTGDFTFNFNPELSRHPQSIDANRQQPFDLDLNPSATSALSDGLFSAADLLLSPPPDAYTLEEPEVLSDNAFDPFADSSPPQHDPELRPKSSRFDFAKKGRGLFGSTDSLQGLASAAAAAATPPSAPLEAPPGIGGRGFPNGLLGPERTESPSSLFGGSMTPVTPSASTPAAAAAHGPPPGLRRQSGSMHSSDPWGSTGGFSVGDALSRGNSRGSLDTQHAQSPASFAAANASLPSFSQSSMAMASSALPTLSSAATHPLPPPSAGSQSQSQTPLPPGFAHLARQPLPSAMAAASNYPLPPPSANRAGPPPGLSPQPQRTASTSPSNAHSKDSSELFSHLMSLANNSQLRNVNENPQAFQDPAILNMSSAQRYPANYSPMDQYGNSAGYGQYYAAQQQQQQQRGQQMGYNAGLPPGMLRR